MVNTVLEKEPNTRLNVPGTDAVRISAGARVHREFVTQLCALLPGLVPNALSLYLCKNG